MDVRTLLGGARMAVGTALWLAPALSAKTIGLGDIGRDARTSYVIRLAGVRDLVLGGAVLMAEDDVAARRALQLGVVVDAADVLAALLARRRQGLTTVGLLLTGGAAAAGVAVGAVALLSTDDTDAIDQEPDEEPTQWPTSS